MTKPLLSIIIPVYNVEKYIRKCIESIYMSSQKEEQYEIIIINDGTTDSSIAEIDDYLISHNNIMLLTQLNNGVSSARNNGIEHACGKYITFVDPDDWIKDNSLDIILELLQGCKDEILIVKSYSEYNKEIFGWSKKIKEKHSYSGDELYRLGYERGSVWGGFILREFINNNTIRFPKFVKNAEDSIFFTICQLYAKKVSFYNILWYIVREREGSASRTFPISQLESYKIALDYVINYMRRDALLSKVQTDILFNLLYRIISALTIRAVTIGNLNCKEILATIDINKYLPIHFQTSSIIKKMKVTLLNLSYHLYFMTIKLIY